MAAPGQPKSLHRCGARQLKSGHIVSPEERARLVRLQDMCVDVGVESRAEAEVLGIRPDLPISLGTHFTILRGGNRYLAKAFDGRIGLGVATEALGQLKTMPHSTTVEMAATARRRTACAARPSSRPQRIRTS